MKKYLLTLSSVALLLACNSSHEEQDAASVQHDSTAKDSVVATVVEETETDDDVTLPSPLRIAGTFKRSGLKFIEASLNPLENANLYTSTYSRALSLGVYSADMAYCLLNKQYSQSKNYLKTCKDIGAELGLNSAFEANNLAQRFENNMGKDDSLMRLVSDLQLQTDLVLEQNKQRYVSAIIFTGAWIETMHSAAQVYLKGENKMAGVILEQVSLINDVIKVLNAQKEKDPNIAALITDLEVVKAEFDGIEAFKGMDMSEVDFTAIRLNAKGINSLCEKIEVLRSKIIKG